MPDLFPEFEEHDSLVRAQALAAHRRHHAIRKLSAAAAALTACLIAAIALRTNDPAAQVEGSPFSAPTLVAAPARVDTNATSNSVSELTDEQLVALFPEGACWIAEVNGAKVLIFADETLERKYLAN